MFAMEPEPTPYDLRWEMFGVPVRVHPMFWVVSVLLGYNAVIGYGGPYLIVWVACVFVSVLLHELGHVLVGRIFGNRGHIVLYGMGGIAIGCKERATRWQRILVSLAGPVAQLLLYFLVRTTAIRILIATREDWREPVLHILEFLLWINLFWALLNLLPIWPLDGGQVTRETCEGLLGRRGVRISLGISMVVAGALAFHGVLTEIKGSPLIPYIPRGMFMILFFGMFCVSSWQALQAETYQRRQWEDDDWDWGR